MLQCFYTIYRTLSFDSTICFLILSIVLYTLFQPKTERKGMSLSCYLILGGISFSLIFQGVLRAILRGNDLIFSQTWHYFYFFLCHVLLAMGWSVWALRGSAFTKLVYALFFATSMQMYRGVCAPLYQLEGVMDPNLYAVLDLATACGLYLFLGLLGLLFYKSGIHRSIPGDRGARRALLYLLVSFLVVVMLPVYLHLVQVSSWVIFIVLSDLPVVYYLFARIIRSYEVCAGLSSR